MLPIARLNKSTPKSSPGLVAAPVRTFSAICEFHGHAGGVHRLSLLDPARFRFAFSFNFRKLERKSEFH